MHELDDDDCQMTDFQGNKTQRDLVQFVEFSKVNNNGVELAREVLEELPRQVE
jgi:GTPase